MRKRYVAACAAALGMGAACTNLDALSIHPAPLGADGSNASGGQPSAGGRDGGDAQIGNESGGNGGSGGRAGSGGTLGTGAAGGVSSGGVNSGGASSGGLSNTTGGSPNAEGGTIIVGPPGSGYDDPVFEPKCIGDQATTVRWNEVWQPPSDLVSARVWTTACCVLYATQPADEIAVLAWDLTTAAFATPTGWWGWQCFDAVPKIQRMAALNLSNNHSEEYALSSASDLWVKREYVSVGRGPWQHIARPAGIRELRDIHAFRSDPYRPMLLALSEGAVFIRGRLTDDPYSAFADWHEVGSIKARRLCGGYAHDGQVEIYAITTDGALAIARGSAPDSDGGVTFSPFKTVPAPGGGAPTSDGGSTQRFTELDCANEANGALSVFAVTESGDLFRGSDFASGWARIDANTPIQATAIAAQSATPSSSSPPYRNDVTLFATVTGGTIYRAVLPAGNDAGPLPVTADWSPANPSHVWHYLDAGLDSG